MEEFIESNSSNIKKEPNQKKIVIQPDGSIVTVRSISKCGFPILEIFDSLNHSHTKIRYTD